MIAGVFAVSTNAALLYFVASAILTSFWYGPVFSAVQAVARPAYRATSAAIHLFFVNAIGFGLGPLTIGFLSDAFNLGKFGGAALTQAEGLRWAIAVAACAVVPAASLFAWASMHTRILRTSGALSS